jgi:copper chaperone CopZ
MEFLKIPPGKLLRGAVAMIWAFSTLDATSANEIVLMVPGIPGPYCAYGVEKRLLELAGVEQVQTLWDSEQIRVVTSDTASISAADIKSAVSRADYPYKYEIRMRE